MIRAYKFLLRPTVRQEQALVEMLRDHCFLYNGALQERRDAWRHPSKTSVTYGMQSAQLKDIRAFDPERQGRWSFSSQQATLRRLDKAMQAFFRRVKSGDTPGYPRFRGVTWFDTVDFPKDGDGCRWDSTRTILLPASASRASATSGSTSTAPWPAGSRPCRSSVRAVSGSSC